MTGLSARALVAAYTAPPLFDGLDLDVAAGQTVAVVGGNGAGKTTLLDTLAGEHGTGTVVVGGRDVSALDAAARARAGMARVLQRPPRYASLTVAELVSLAAPAGTATDDVLGPVGLAAYAGRQVAELSTGQRRLLDLACATARRPTVLLLDEPSAGLARGEVDALAGALRGLAATGSTAVVLVEHDERLVAAVADEVLVLAGGQLRPVAGTVPDEPGSDIADVAVAGAVEAVAASADRPVCAPKPGLSTWTLARLGLRELAAGALSVLVLGVLNRVMHVEYGVPLLVVGLLLGAYNLAAPVALLAGHRSDTRPVRGRHRAPYVVAGAVTAAVAASVAPAAARLVADRPGPVAYTVALAVFLLLGAGMYGGGAAYFALLADLTPDHDRARASAVVYSMLMLGILGGAALSALALDDDGGNVGSLFAAVSVLLVVATVLAVRGLDRAPGRTGDDRSARRAAREVAALPGALPFFGFLVVTTLALLAQQAVLEPFGGVVLHLGVRATSAFNAVQIAGVLAGMAAGTGLARRHGDATVARCGLAVAAVGFFGLAVTAETGVAAAVWPAIAVMGLGAGLVNVGALALMLGMSAPGRVGASMALWTVAHAVADGLATAGGGAAHDAFRAVGFDRPSAYGAVFAAEAVLALLAGVTLRRR